MKKREWEPRKKKRPERWLIPAIAAAVLVAAVVVLMGKGILPNPFADKNPDNLPSYVQQEFLTPNPYSRPQTPLKEVNNIVIHYVGNPNTRAIANRNYFEGLKDSKSVQASSHFIVGLEGEVIQCIPLSEVSYCTSKERNVDTVAIEVCHPDESGKFNDSSYQSAVKLTAWLCSYYGLTEEDVIRHYDVTGKLCPLYYVEHEDAWAQFKADVKSGIKNTQ